jgi:hypothetical protein
VGCESKFYRLRESRLKARPQGIKPQEFFVRPRALTRRWPAARNGIRITPQEILMRFELSTRMQHGVKKSFR